MKADYYFAEAGKYYDRMAGLIMLNVMLRK
jgi:hypothetical protein